MLFNSPQYIFLFLPLTFLGWVVLCRFWTGRFAVAFVVAASLFFYAQWYAPYLVVLLVSLLGNYGLARLIDASRRQRVRLWTTAIGIAANLAVLFWFKYFNFASDNFAHLLRVTPFIVEHALPLGISFFTFQKIAYLADAYSRKVRDFGFWRYCLFIVFFPQLIAGPIVHHDEVVAQFLTSFRAGPHGGNIGAGLFVFTIGLFKKVVLADTFAIWADVVFNAQGQPQFFSAWSGALSFALQIYFDFSGYTDMAIGAGLLFNVRLPVNFNSPYKATSVADFWNRWHMTLGRWIRQYLYIPLGGNREGPVATARNLIVVMLAVGIWHGAAWTFVLWGVLHGTAMAIGRGWQRVGRPLPGMLAQALTFAFVLVAWVAFRAESVEAAARIWGAMAAPPDPVAFMQAILRWPALQAAATASWIGNWPGSGVSADISQSVPWIAAGMAIVFFAPNSMQLVGFVEPPRPMLAYDPNSITKPVVLGILLLLSVVTMLTTRSTQFIYFNF
jgi:alginate O-acetyltransferase complex protein AlgI